MLARRGLVAAADARRGLVAAAWWRRPGRGGLMRLILSINFRCFLIY